MCVVVPPHSAVDGYHQLYLAYLNAVSGCRGRCVESRCVGAACVAGSARVGDECERSFGGDRCCLRSDVVRVGGTTRVVSFADGSEDAGACEGKLGGHGEQSVDDVSGVVRSLEHADIHVVTGSGEERVDGQDVRGPNWERNRAWKQKRKNKKAVPPWRLNAKAVSDTPSLSTSVVTVDTRTAEEIEAFRTLAMRRTVENKLAIVRGKYQLASFRDKDKTAAIRRLEVARIEERINTTKAKSQASYKKCDTPLNSVGSAGSAGEFAWKQEIRKRDAVIKERDYYEQQLEVAMKYLSDAGKRAIAELPEPYIPTLEDIEFEDADISPYYSREEMEAEAAKWVGDEAW